MLRLQSDSRKAIVLFLLLLHCTNRVDDFLHNKHLSPRLKENIYSFNIYIKLQTGKFLYAILGRMRVLIVPGSFRATYHIFPPRRKK